MSQSASSDAARTSFDLDLIRDLQDAVNARLDALAPNVCRDPKRLVESMRYSLLAPGKRVRALITLLTAEALGGELERAIVPACSVEMVHAASLIIDDLPSMDDASMRRGRLSNHRAFGEDTSILAAIGLLSESFRGHRQQRGTRRAQPSRDRRCTRWMYRRRWSSRRPGDGPSRRQE